MPTPQGVPAAQAAATAETPVQPCLDQENIHISAPNTNANHTVAPAAIWETRMKWGGGMSNPRCQKKRRYGGS
jgi:hypothetical protein